MADLTTFVFHSFPAKIHFRGDGIRNVFLGNSGDRSSNPEFFSGMDFFEEDDPTEVTPYNDLLNESTGIRWLGKNLKKVGNPEYVGTAHYRRFLDVDETKLDPDRIFCRVEKQPFNIFRTYSFYHVGDDLRTFNSLFSRSHREYARDLNDFMNGNEYAARNMFAMSREMFLEYASFQKSCLDILLKMAKITDFRSRDRY